MPTNATDHRVAYELHLISMYIDSITMIFNCSKLLECVFVLLHSPLTYDFRITGNWLGTTTPFAVFEDTIVGWNFLLCLRSTMSVSLTHESTNKIYYILSSTARCLSIAYRKVFVLFYGSNFGCQATHSFHRPAPRTIHLCSQPIVNSAHGQPANNHITH